MGLVTKCKRCNSRITLRTNHGNCSRCLSSFGKLENEVRGKEPHLIARRRKRIT